MRLYRASFLFAAVLSASAVSAARITAADAVCAVRAFVAEGRRLDVRIGGFPVSARRHAVTDVAGFYSVRMSGGGTVFLSGDDESEPVIAYTSGDVDFDSLDAASPLRALLERDIRLRRGTSAAKAKWRRLFAKGDAGTPYPSLFSLVALSAASLVEPGDIRVPALVKTRWGQGSRGGYPCFNYYTPGRYQCGCVATAMAQVMRYHRWPDASHPVNASAFRCYVGGVETNLTMQGGIYEWGDMPTDADGDRISNDVHRQSIGKLTGDVGISVRMYYTGVASSAFAILTANAFTETWRFGQATYFNDEFGYLAGGNSDANRRKVMTKVFFSNFDSGCPVVLGISGKSSSGGDTGHCVVADGYGYDGGTDFVHLNFGWSGSGDLWYNLPSVGVSSFDFDQVDEIVYNIFPTGGTSCATLSGRVLDQFGRAVVGASVKIYESGRSTPTTVLTASETGVYGAVLTGGKSFGKSYDVVAVSSDGSATNRLDGVRLLTPSVSVFSSAVSFTGGQTEELVCRRGVSSVGNAGNSWGNDIVLNIPRKEPKDFYVSAETGLDSPDRGTFAAPYRTIQYAITNAPPLVAGDVIRVLPGTYYDCVETPATKLSIISTDGPSVTFLDARGCDCCYFGYDNPSNLLSGFTVTNGARYGGICFGTAVDCVITDCENTEAAGGGAYMATLRDCVLRGNRAYYGGGAGMSVLTNCLLVGNAAYGYFDYRGGYGGGFGGGVYECELINCTVADNIAEICAGGALLHQTGEARNSIVCGNTCLEGADYGNDVYGNHYWTMSNSLSDVDAGFRDPANGDYRIVPTSRAFDAGDGTFVSVDHDLAGTNRVWGASVDIGCYEYHLPDGVADCGRVGVAAALAAEGYRGDFAAAVTTPKDYAYLVEWTRDRGLSAPELNASPTGLLSPALGAEALLAVAPTNVVVCGFAPVGSDWRVSVALPGYERARINEPLLKASVGVVGAVSVDGVFTSDGLVQTVEPTATNVEVTVTPPAGEGPFFIRAFVR